MATLIDYYNNTIEQNAGIIDSIQNRYLDPYTIRLTTDTNNYRFIENKINKITEELYGNDLLVRGLEVTNIAYFDDYIEVYVNKGAAICDSTVIDFIDDFIIRVPKSDLDTTGSEYNIIALDYIHVQNYPPRIAFPIVTSMSNTSNYDISTIIAVFKTDGSNTTYLNPDNGTLIEHLTININGEDKEVLPAIGQFMDHNHNLSDLADVDNTDKADGRVLKWDATAGKHVYVDFSSGSASTFLDLTDTPSDYTDEAGKLVRVKSTEDGLEFFESGEGSGLDADKWDGGDKYISTDDPSGGQDGDVWFKVES